MLSTVSNSILWLGSTQNQASPSPSWKSNLAEQDQSLTNCPVFCALNFMNLEVISNRINRHPVVYYDIWYYLIYIITLSYVIISSWLWYCLWICLGPLPLAPWLRRATFWVHSADALNAGSNGRGRVGTARLKHLTTIECNWMQLNAPRCT